MKSVQDTFELYNGVKIPCVGLGTYKSTDEIAVQSVKDALQLGYRLVDTAAAYGNEIPVGLGIRESGIPREEIFITSKLRNNDHGYDGTMEAFERTITRLGVDYLDLYLIHWPIPIQYRIIWEEAMLGTWHAMEELYKAGKIRAIGVSNFKPHHIETLMEHSEILPMVNQIRYCPGDTAPEIVDYCREKNILVEGYSPFGQGLIFGNETLKEVAAKYGKTVAQIALRWSLQNGILPLPKSGTPSRIKGNMEIFDFEISAEDMEKINSLPAGCCGIAPDSDNIKY